MKKGMFNKKNKSKASIQSIEELKSIKFEELSLDNVYYWPHLLKKIVYVIVFSIILVLGFYFIINETNKNLNIEKINFQSKLLEFENKYKNARVIDKLTEQMNEANDQFALLLQRLPADNEIPNLIENIAKTASKTGLLVSKIELGSEITGDFYNKLPINIELEGDYNMLGNFVAGVSSIDRIVTFDKMKITKNQNEKLKIEISASTYRYLGDK